MDRREFLRVVGLGAAGLGGLAMSGCAGRFARSGGEGSDRRQPNILLIVSDDQGYNDLGCYGTYDMFRNDLVDHDHLHTKEEYAVSREKPDLLHTTATSP